MTGTNETDPDRWAESIRTVGCTAAVAPKCLLVEGCPPERIRAFREAARAHDVVIAEVGAWSNPISPDGPARARAVAHCKQRLAVADALGARCCVNIAGSRHPHRWEGPHADNYSRATFDLIVRTTREIIDEAQPQHTVFAIETMPHVPPDSPEAALALVQAVDRPGRFAIHLDPVNLLNTPRLALASGPFIRRCFDLLGNAIVAVHAKDLRLGPDFPVHLKECPPGEGVLDYPAFLRCIEELDSDLPVIIEHLPDPASYARARSFLLGLSRVNRPER